METTTMVWVLLGVAAVVGAIVFGGSSLVYFREQRRPLPPKPTAREVERERARHAAKWEGVA
ncbi:hypothetical protein [Nocardioides solisilvae]|uniref:hypothetical protein n=1 Tax=Nocardioides solisilvae TaxID=1542435 RepID=UPI0013A578C6|nr:hypothetical protein [Nocardioides solisilvae]